MKPKPIVKEVVHFEIGGSSDCYTVGVLDEIPIIEIDECSEVDLGLPVTPGTDVNDDKANKSVQSSTPSGASMCKKATVRLKPKYLVSRRKGRRSRLSKKPIRTLSRSAKNSLTDGPSYFQDLNLPIKLPEPKYRIIDDYQQIEAPALPSAYIQYNQPTQKELENEVEYDLDEQDCNWLKIVNSMRKQAKKKCVTKNEMEILMDRLEKESHYQYQMQIARLDQNEDTSICCICMDGEPQDSNAILFCDMCNLAIHQDCYGVPHIPDSQWLCRRCHLSAGVAVKCIFCPNKFGAFKQTDDGRWAHVICALLIPEVGFSNLTFLEPVDNVGNIPTARWKLTCFICKQKGVGACVQCAKVGCSTAFHATCAQEASVCMKTDGGSDSTCVKQVVFCDNHAPPELLLERKQKKGFADHSSRRKKLKEARKVLAENRDAIPVVSIPSIPEVRVQEILLQVKFSKPCFIEPLMAYWKLKRLERHGAPLLHRFQESLHMTSTYSEEVNCYNYWQQIRQNTENARIRSELVRKREKSNLLSSDERYLELNLKPLSIICLNVLEALGFGDPMNVFLYPVDSTKVPDYLSIVKQPIDISMMREKANSYEYNSIDELEKDFQLMINNCFTYNSKDTSYFKAAVRLKKLGEAIFPDARRDLEYLGVDTTACRLPNHSSVVSGGSTYDGMIAENINIALKDKCSLDLPVVIERSKFPKRPKYSLSLNRNQKKANPNRQKKVNKKKIPWPSKSKKVNVRLNLQNPIGRAPRTRSKKAVLNMNLESPSVQPINTIASKGSKAMEVKLQIKKKILHIAELVAHDGIGRAPRSRGDKAARNISHASSLGQQINPVVRPRRTKSFKYGGNVNRTSQETHIQVNKSRNKSGSPSLAKKRLSVEFNLQNTSLRSDIEVNSFGSAPRIRSLAAAALNPLTSQVAIKVTRISEKEVNNYISPPVQTRQPLIVERDRQKNPLVRACRTRSAYTALNIDVDSPGQEIKPPRAKSSKARASVDQIIQQTPRSSSGLPLDSRDNSPLGHSRRTRSSRTIRLPSNQDVIQDECLRSETMVQLSRISEKELKNCVRPARTRSDYATLNMDLESASGQEINRVVGPSRANSCKPREKSNSIRQGTLSIAKNVIKTNMSPPAPSKQLSILEVHRQKNPHARTCRTRSAYASLNLDFDSPVQEIKPPRAKSSKSSAYVGRIVQETSHSRLPVSVRQVNSSFGPSCRTRSSGTILNTGLPSNQDVIQDECLRSETSVQLSRLSEKQMKNYIRPARTRSDYAILNMDLEPLSSGKEISRVLRPSRAQSCKTGEKIDTIRPATSRIAMNVIKANIVPPEPSAQPGRVGSGELQSPLHSPPQTRSAKSAQNLNLQTDRELNPVVLRPAPAQSATEKVNRSRQEVPLVDFLFQNPIRLSAHTWTRSTEPAPEIRLSTGQQEPRKVFKGPSKTRSSKPTLSQV